MVFWRKKKNEKEQEEQEQADKVVHPPGAPATQPSTDYEPEIDDETEHRLKKTEAEIIDEAEFTPTPEPILEEQEVEDEELSDHSEEGGWLSRLTSGLSKSTSKITTGLTDLVTKKKLDQDMLDQLEEVLIEADLGPKTAMKVVEDFSQGRFGKDLEENEIKEALAESLSKILSPVAGRLNVQKPADGSPFVILMCGVNGAGKTTTIGKLALRLQQEQGLKVMMAAGDTFRAAAVEQLEIWSKRTGCPLIKKDVGADAAAVAFEAYSAAKEQGADVLLIDTAGRLQNKSNLMEELAKIVRVLKKQDEALPHEVVLVLDSTTGQNAFSQLETFKEMVDVSGLIVTKLDGSAKGGVLVGLADQFGVPVYAVGVGEAVEDMQAFSPEDYAKSLVGLV